MIRTLLEKRLNRNSQNSSSPPSRKKPGGPASHIRGYAVSRPESRPGGPGKVTTCSCGADLSGVPPTDVEPRPIVDLPEPRLEGTEYRLAEACRPVCRKTVTDPAPEGANAPAQYGPRFLSLLADRHEDQALPAERVRPLLVRAPLETRRTDSGPDAPPRSRRQYPEGVEGTRETQRDQPRQPCASSSEGGDLSQKKRRKAGLTIRATLQGQGAGRTRRYLDGTLRPFQK